MHGTIQPRVTCQSQCFICVIFVQFNFNFG